MLDELWENLSERGPASAQCAGLDLAMARRDDVAFDEEAQSKLLHLFDVVEKMCLKAVDGECVPGFLQSAQYKYVLALKVKEQTTLSIDDFRAVRVLAEGRFGQVRNRCGGLVCVELARVAARVLQLRVRVRAV